MVKNYDEKTIAFMDQCSKLIGTLREKYPSMSEKEGVPMSIIKEYSNAKYLLHMAQRSATPTWSTTLASNGVSVDAFEQKNFEEAIKGMSSFREQNQQFVSNKDVDEHKFPVLDKEQLDNKISGIQNFREASDFHTSLSNNDEYSYTQRALLEEDYIPKVKEIEKEMASEELNADQDKITQAETTAESTESTQSSLGSKIVDFFKQKVVDPIKDRFISNNENQNSQDEQGPQDPVQ